LNANSSENRSQKSHGEIAEILSAKKRPFSLPSRFHNERPLKTSRRHRTSLQAAETQGGKPFFYCRLEIADVEAADGGAYKAVAKNKFGEGHATINLNFEEGDD